MRKPKIIQIEGSRLTGKTFLINHLNVDVKTYKFPFAKYFYESFTPVNSTEIQTEMNSKKELYYLTLGYDITILDLMKQGIINQDLVVDRGILSNIVFGIQSGRITEEEGRDTWEWLNKEYSEYFKIIYIYTAPQKDSRNKDMWDIYDRQRTVELYQDFIKDTTITRFENKFDTTSVERFNNCVTKMLS